LQVGADGSRLARWACVMWVDARMDALAHKVADLDRRLGQIDAIIEEAAKRRWANAASRR
jgi:hypothetical protein